MSRFIFICFLLFFILLISGNVFGQSADTTVTDAAPVGDFVDLSGQAVIIKVEAEKPRVNIISDRIKPEFGNVNLDKSFLPELTGEGEKIVVIEQNKQQAIKPIEVEKIINKVR